MVSKKTCYRNDIVNTVFICFDWFQLVQKHQDAFQASTSFPDAFYPGICSGGKDFLDYFIEAAPWFIASRYVIK